MPKIWQRLTRPTAAVAVLILAACSTSEPQRSASPGGSYKVGRPYHVNGVWYYPSEDLGYDETGLASWYGSDFHGKPTANGEAYDMNALTAAHRTLPMPSVVEVRNLENGRSIALTVNDRGPFVGGRIIDVSRRAAEVLGFRSKGTALVRVRVLVPETLEAKMQAQIASGDASPEYVDAAPVVAVDAQELSPPDGVQTSAAPANTASASPATSAPTQMAAAPQQAPAIPDRTLPDTGIYVQAGAFTNDTNAERLRNQLGWLGNVLVSEATVDGRQYYRVRLGPLASVEEGDLLLPRVMQAGAPNAHIVVE